MFLSNTALKKPVLTLVVLIVLMMFGLLAVRTTGVDIVPNVVMPYVSVTVVYPGASPEEIETSVAKPIEDAVVQVDGLKHVTATCANNFCQMMLEFELGRDQNVAAEDVRSKLSAIEGDFPDGVEKPEVQKFDINAIPVVTLALTGGSSVEELYDYADERLSSRLSTVSGVASVELIGGEEREVVVTVDRARLAAAGLTLAEVVDKVGHGNLKIPSGQLDEHGRSFSVMFDAAADNPENLGRIEIGKGKGGDRVYLRDVASFAFGTKRAESVATCDGRKAIILKVTKRGEANAAATVAGLRAAYEAAAARLPGGMRLNWVRDDGAYIHATVAGGVDAIWQGVLLTGFVLLLFLADWRMALTAFVSIPVTIVISLLAFSASGYTANIITMNAIGISIGILVANSIVVLENVARRGGVGKEPVASAVSEIAIAVTASALTNVVVFLPIATMRTMAGQFFVPFAIVVTVSTFASLLVSFTLTPMIAAKLGHRGEGFNLFLAKVFAPWNRAYAYLEGLYSRTLAVVLRRPKTSLLLFTGATLVGFALLAPHVKSDFTPVFDKGEISVNLEFPADSALSRSAERTEAIAEKLRSVTDAKGKPVVVHRTVMVGKTQGILGQVSRGSHLAQIDCVLTPMMERADTIQEVSEKLRALLREEPDVLASVLVPVIVGGASQSVQLKLLGDDLAMLDAAGLAVAGDLKASGLATDVTHNVRPGRPELKVRPNRAVLNDLGVSPSFLGLNLRAALAGLTPATFTAGDRSYDIRVRYDERDGAGQVAEMNFPGPDGRPFTLGAVAEVEPAVQKVQIVRCEKQRSAIVYANPAPGVGMGEAIAKGLSSAQARLPRGSEVLLGGQAEYMAEAFDEFGLVTVVAIALTYLLLAAILESWALPFVILFTIPFSYLGIFAAVVAANQTLSIFGLLAGIMLVGVVVNAAILIIDAWRQTGDIAVASREKFRPVLMSCAAALFGMLPMALGGGLGCELRQSMGIGSVGGLLVSSLVSLYFIPVLCALKKSDEPASRFTGRGRRSNSTISLSGIGCREGGRSKGPRCGSI